MKKNHSWYRESDYYILITNSIRKMKITLIVVLLSAVQILANNGYSQNTRFTITKENTSIEDVLGILEKSSDFNFLYNGKLVDVTQKVTLNVKDELLEGTLNELFRNINITYRIFERQVVLSPAEGTGNSQQQKKITGKVTDPSGATLPGVSVVLKGTTNGIITDNDGKFSLTNVPENGILQFSFVGMRTQEIAIGIKGSINVVLTEESIGIEEVVAVGYGTIKKADVTTSVSTISSKQLANRPVMSLAEALAGQVAGVEIQQSSGQPGGSDILVRIRGTNSISSNSEPLYVVDGVPTPNALSIISNNDIENVTILKDVSATAIYGSRGSSGVIMITTKRAKLGAPTISFSSSIGMQQISHKIPMMGKDDYIQLIIDSKNNAWVDRNPAVNKATDSNAVRQAGGAAGNLNYIIPDGQTNPWGSFKYNILDPSDVAKMANTDWQSEVYRNAPISQQEISITGGTNDTRFIISGNYDKQDGIVINSNYSRFGTRAYIETKVRKNLKVGLQLMGNYGNGRLQAQGRNQVSGGGWGINLGAVSMAPVFPVTNTNGTYSDMKRNPEILGSGQPGFNPVELANNRYHYQKNYSWSAYGFAEWEIIPNLTYKFTLNGQMAHGEDSFFEPKGVNDYGSTTTGTQSSNSQVNSGRYLLENLLNYKITLAKKYNLAFMGGYTYENASTGSIFAQAKDAPTNYVQLVNGTPMAASTGASQFSLISYLGRLQFNYDERYLLTGTVRSDGSSRFSPDKKWGSFPSLSAGWNISKEAFMENVKLVSDLKIRGGWGISGNNAIGDFEWQGNMGGNWYPTGNPQAGVYGVTPGSKMQNFDLTWEKTKEYNIGLDLGIIKNRIFVTADYYKRTSYDLLLMIPTPVISGQTSILNNIGTMQNSGVEFTLSTKNLVGNFKWKTEFNISHNRNEVLALGPDNAPIYATSAVGGPWFVTKVGFPVSTFYGYKVEGIFKDDADLQNHIQYLPGKDRPGQMYYKDISGPTGKPDGKIDANDQTSIGNNYPEFTAGLTNHFSYKNFSLDVQLTSSYGGETYSIFFREFVKGTNGSRGAPAWLLDRWKSSAEPGNGVVPAVTTVNRGLDNGSTSYFVQDNSYLRVRNVSLSYEFHNSLLKSLNISQLRLYVTANNLYTFTKYFGYDPEANTSSSLDPSSSGALTRGADYLAYPMSRTYTMGLNLTF